MYDKGNWINLYEIKILADNWFSILIIKASQTRTYISAIVWFAFGVIPAIIFYITSVIDNSVYLEGQRGLSQDYIFLSYYVFIPFTINLALLNFPDLSGVLHSLKDVIITEKPVIENIKNRTNNSTDKNDCLSVNGFNELLKSYETKIIGQKKFRYLKYLFFIGGLLWIAMSARTHWFAEAAYGMDIWSSQNYIFSFTVRTIYESIVFGLIFPLILYKYLIILYTIKNICKKLTKKNVLKIRPLNPDRAGGLGALGRYSFKMVMLLVPPFIPILTYIFFGNVNILFIIGLTLYIPLLIFAFFYPLSGAHSAMRKFKDQELRILSIEFNKIYDSFIRDVENNQLNKLPSDFQLLEKLDNLYSKTEKMPVWPFDIETLTKFGSIIAALITSIWLNWLFGKMVQM